MKSRFVVLDTNVFIIYLLGLIDPKLISNNKRTSLYIPDDFYTIQEIIGNRSILTCPNVLTEIDNLLDLKGNYKYQYINAFKKIVKNNIEKCLNSAKSINDPLFYSLGLTDLNVINLAIESDLLISADSELCQYALSKDIKVLDMVKYVNDLRYLPN